MLGLSAPGPRETVGRQERIKKCNGTGQLLIGIVQAPASPVPWPARPYIIPAPSWARVYASWAQRARHRLSTHQNTRTQCRSTHIYLCTVHARVKRYECAVPTAHKDSVAAALL